MNRSVDAVPATDDLLKLTLAAARKDPPTVSPEGKSLRRLTSGVVVRPLPIHPDERGFLMEAYDVRQPGFGPPLVQVYVTTLRPGYVKGWNLHLKHDDRYVILQGEMKLVLYDVRPDSPTCGEICEIAFTEHQRSMVNIPVGVWHADQNIGTRDVVLLNAPTRNYDYADPDKYRLPIDTPLIPHSFAGWRGW